MLSNKLLFTVVCCNNSQQNQCRGTRLIHAGMLFNRLADRSAEQLAIRPLSKNTAFMKWRN